MPRLVGGAMTATVRIVDPASGRAGYGLVRIDTGDDVAIIAPSLMAAIGVQPVGHTDVEGIDGKPIPVPIYRIDVDLGRDGYLTNVEAYGLDIRALGYAGLFGDNELDQGILVRDGPAGSWSFTATAALPPPGPSYGVPIAIGAIGIAGILAAGFWPRRRRSR